MKHLSPLIAVAVAASAAIAGMQMAWAQPAKGAAASFDRVREVTANRFKDTKLTGEGCDYRTTAHDFGYHDYSTGFRCCSDTRQE